MYFNWRVNDSEGYILQLTDGRRLVLGPETAQIGTPGNLQPVSYVHYDVFKTTILNLKMNMNVVKRIIQYSSHEIESPIWVRRSPSKVSKDDK